MRGTHFAAAAVVTALFACDDDATGGGASGGTGQGGEVADGGSGPGAGGGGAGGAPGCGPCVAKEGAPDVWTVEWETIVDPLDPWFGLHVDLDGQTLAVGTMKYAPEYETGSIHVFEEGGGAFGHVIELDPDDSVDCDRFGESFDLEGDVLVATARKPSESCCPNGCTGSGRVLVFERIAGTWTDVGPLAIANGEPGPAVIAGQQILVPAGGSVLVFEKAGGAWSKVSELSPVPAVGPAVCGYCPPPALLAVDGDTLLVGSDVWTRSAGVWNRKGSLDVSGTPALLGDVAVFGDPSFGLINDGQGLPTPGKGKVRIFVRTGDCWLERATIEGAQTDQLGCSVAVGSAFVVAAACASNPDGRVATFSREACAWSPVAPISYASGELDNFWISVSLDGDRLAVGRVAYSHSGPPLPPGRVEVRRASP